MTDRDFFAAAALTGLLANGDFTKESIPSLAFSMAEEMLKERAKTNLDAAPEAKAKSCNDCGPQATPELGNPVLAPPQDGTGNTPALTDAEREAVETAAYVAEWFDSPNAATLRGLLERFK